MKYRFSLVLLLLSSIARADYGPEESSAPEQPVGVGTYVIVGSIAAGALAGGLIGSRSKNNNTATCAVAGATIGFLGGFGVSFLLPPPRMVTAKGEIAPGLLATLRF